MEEEEEGEEELGEEADEEVNQEGDGVGSSIASSNELTTAAASPYHLRKRAIASPVAPAPAATSPVIEDYEHEMDEDYDSSTSNRSSSSQDDSAESDFDNEFTDGSSEHGEDAVDSMRVESPCVQPVELTGEVTDTKPNGGGADAEPISLRAVALKVLPVRAGRYSRSMFVPGIISSHKRTRLSEHVQTPTTGDRSDDAEALCSSSSSLSRLSRRECVRQRLEQKLAVLKAGQAKLLEAIRGSGNRNWKALVPIAAPNTEVEKNAIGFLHHATVVHAYVTKLIKRYGRDDTVKSVAREVAEETGCGIWQVTRWHRDYFRLVSSQSPPPTTPKVSAHITTVPSAPVPTLTAAGRDGMGAVGETHGGDDAVTTPEGGVPLAGSKAVYTWSDGTGRLEVVTIVKIHSQIEGEAISIFVPSIAREKQTVIERLDFRRNAIDDCLRIAQAPSVMASLSPPLAAAPLVTVPDPSPSPDAPALTVGSLLAAGCDGVATDTPVAFIQALLRHACTTLFPHEHASAVIAYPAPIFFDR